MPNSRNCATDVPHTTPPMAAHAIALMHIGQGSPVV
jgi:hypothetical protein